MIYFDSFKFVKDDEAIISCDYACFEQQIELDYQRWKSQHQEHTEMEPLISLSPLKGVPIMVDDKSELKGLQNRLTELQVSLANELKECGLTSDWSNYAEDLRLSIDFVERSIRTIEFKK